jgi:hypothetical protein
MAMSKKKLSGVSIIIVLVLSSLSLIAEPAYCNPVPTPSNPIPTPSVPTLCSSSIDNNTLEMVIQNQPFASYIDNGWNISLFYNIRLKEHTTENWTEFYDPEDGYPYQSPGPTQTFIELGTFGDSGFTLRSVSKIIEVTSGTHEDFQVEAMIGYLHRVPNPNATGLIDMYPWVFTGETSSWSTTQTITPPPSNKSASIPTESPNISSPSPSPKIEPTSTSKQPSGFLGTNLPVEYGYAIVAVLVIIVVAVLSLVYYKKPRKQKVDG